MGGIEITTNEAIFGDAHLQGSGAGIFQRCDTVFLSQGKNSEDATNPQITFPLIDRVAENADLASGSLGAPQELSRTQRHFLGAIFVLDAIPTGSLAKVLTEKLVGTGIQDPHLRFIPLHLDGSPDPSGRNSVIGGGDFHAAVQVNDALSMLVVTEGARVAVEVSAIFLRRT